MKSGNFFAELKRRNVIRAAILYLGAVWALAQGISQLGPSLGAPEWATRWFLVAAGIGFPFWIAFAWFYEFTPEGLKRESEIDPAKSITRHTGRNLAFAIIGVLTVAVVLLLTDRFVLRHGVNETSAVPIAEKSTAVLPFENLSSDKENAYFAAGLQDEIVSRLAGLGELKVISRASTEKYPSRPQNLKTIAAELGVSNILEGSVQKLANEAHINVQLINALSDSHVWAQSYDRTLEHVFVVEGEIAQRVADALRVKLLPEQIKKLNVLPTQNSHAYDLLLKGEYALDRAWKSGNDEKDLDLAISYFEEATDYVMLLKVQV